MPLVALPVRYSLKGIKSNESFLELNLDKPWYTPLCRIFFSKYFLSNCLLPILREQLSPTQKAQDVTPKAVEYIGEWYMYVFCSIC